MANPDDGPFSVSKDTVGVRTAPRAAVLVAPGTRPLRVHPWFVDRHYPSLHVTIRHCTSLSVILSCLTYIWLVHLVSSPSFVLNVTIHHRLDIFVFAFHAVCFTSILRHVIVGRSPGVHGVHILDATCNAWGPAGVVIPTAGLVGRSRGIAYL